MQIRFPIRVSKAVATAGFSMRLSVSRAELASEAQVEAQLDAGGGVTLDERETPSRRLRSHAIATLVAVGLSATYFSFPQSVPLAGLVVPFALMAAAYLVLIGTPFWVGRTLSLATWASRPFVAVTYILWSVLIAFATCDFSTDVLGKVTVRLPAYVDTHGFLAMVVLAAALLVYQLARRSPLRESDFLSLAPSLCVIAAMPVSSYLNRPFGSRASTLDMLTLDVHSLTPTYILLIAASTLAGVIGYALRSSPEAKATQ